MYGLGAVCFTMLITAIGLQFYVFCESFFKQIVNEAGNSDWVSVDFNIYELLNGLFGISAVLITFGVIIGKVKPLQLIIITMFELFFHAFNYEVILNSSLRVADVGGTYADHMFGAYFGLAVSWCLTRHRKPTDPKTGYTADIFSLIGTLFLWIYWPSFVGGGAQADSVQQQRAIINTILALSASTIMTFYLSCCLSKEIQFRPVDIQNATLAGGVAIGCVANLSLNPVNAIFIGAAAGSLSTVGYYYIQPWIFKNLNIHDTCGVHNLHAMPSVIGGIASVILAAYKQGSDRNHDQDIYYHDGQAWRQMAGIIFVILFAIFTGLITGLVINLVDQTDAIEDFNDSTYWEVAEDFDGGNEGDVESIGTVDIEKHDIESKKPEREDRMFELAMSNHSKHSVRSEPSTVKTDKR